MLSGFTHLHVRACIVTSVDLTRDNEEVRDGVILHDCFLPLSSHIDSLQRKLRGVPSQEGPALLHALANLCVPMLWQLDSTVSCMQPSNSGMGDPAPSCSGPACRSCQVRRQICERSAARPAQDHQRGQGQQLRCRNDGRHVIDLLIPE